MRRDEIRGRANVLIGVAERLYLEEYGNIQAMVFEKLGIAGDEKKNLTEQLLVKELARKYTDMVATCSGLNAEKGLSK